MLSYLPHTVRPQHRLAEAARLGSENPGLVLTPLLGQRLKKGQKTRELAIRKKVTPPKFVGPAVEWDSLLPSIQRPRPTSSLAPICISLRTVPSPQTPSFLGSFLSLQSTNLSNVS